MCPRCHSNAVSRSKRRKFLDFVMWFFAMKAYRCRDCQRRFYVPSRIDRKLKQEREWLRDVQEEPNAVRVRRVKKRKR